MQIETKKVVLYRFQMFRLYLRYLQRALRQSLELTKT